jgi:hypothetical protein
MHKEDVKVGIIAIILGAVGIAAIFSLSLGIGAINRSYNVWAEGKAGEAELARAEFNRGIRTLEAKAQEDAAHHLAASEVIRAKGVARANNIIGDSLQGNEAYLRYLWIQGLQTNQMQVVYVPTEANLPILEAGIRPSSTVK